MRRGNTCGEVGRCVPGAVAAPGGVRGDVRLRELLQGRPPRLPHPLHTAAHPGAPPARAPPPLSRGALKWGPSAPEACVPRPIGRAALFATPAELRGSTCSALFEPLTEGRDSGGVGVVPGDTTQSAVSHWATCVQSYPRAGGLVLTGGWCVAACRRPQTTDGTHRCSPSFVLGRGASICNRRRRRLFAFQCALSYGAVRMQSHPWAALCSHVRAE